MTEPKAKGAEFTTAELASYGIPPEHLFQAP